MVLWLRNQTKSGGAACGLVETEVHGSTRAESVGILSSQLSAPPTDRKETMSKGRLRMRWKTGSIRRTWADLQIRRESPDLPRCNRDCNVRQCTERGHRRSGQPPVIAGWGSPVTFRCERSSDHELEGQPGVAKTTKWATMDQWEKRKRSLKGNHEMTESKWFRSTDQNSDLTWLGQGRKAAATPTGTRTTYLWSLGKSSVDGVHGLTQYHTLRSD